jgi:hypothetical protein
MEELQQDIAHDTPVWAIFGDLMSGLVGVFVLILIWVMGYQLELTQSLNNEVTMREAEQKRRIALEDALAGPLASGRVTLSNGRIGIRIAARGPRVAAQLGRTGASLPERT